MKKAMTDGQAMAIANRLTEMNWQMTKLVQELSQHPNGEEMIRSLRINGYDNPAHADDVIHHHLIRSARWVKNHGTYQFS